MTSGSREVSLIGAGDIYMKEPLHQLEGSAEGAAHFEQLVARMRAADLRFANLEEPLTTGGFSREKANVLYGDPSLARYLDLLHLDIVSLANNHILDRDVEGLADTIRLLDEHRIQHVGAGANLAEARAHSTLEHDGTRVAFVGLTSTLPLGSGAGRSRPGVFPLHVATAYVAERTDEMPGRSPVILTIPEPVDVELIKESVAQAKAAADYAVVSVHWGVMGQDMVHDYQIEVAHAMIDAGADAILGHHPHRLHAVEVYRGRPIFYSLANFIFHPLPVSEHPHLVFRRKLSADVVYSLMHHETMMVQVTFGDGGVKEARLIPLVTDGFGEPRLASGDLAGMVFDRMSALSSVFGAKIERVGDEALVRLTD